MPSNSKNNSNNTSSNNNDQNQILELINAKWKIEQKYFDETKPIPTTFYDLEKHRSRIENRPWPRLKPIDQLGFEKFYSRIIDPTTGKPYEQRDSKGREIEQPDGKGPIRYYVRTLIRYRDFDDKEYILTTGSVYGFSSLSETLNYPVHRLESYSKTLFDSRRNYDNKTQSFSEVTTGILSAKDIYTLPFSQENLDQILSENIITKTTPQVYIDKMTIRSRIDMSNPVSFIIQNYNKEAHAVEGNTYQERLERFRNLSWIELFEWRYLKSKDDNNKNNNSVNNTQHFR